MSNKKVGLKWLKIAQKLILGQFRHLKNFFVAKNYMEDNAVLQLNCKHLGTLSRLDKMFNLRT